MPVNSLCFRAACGLFLPTYHSFMAKRIQLVVKTRLRVITVRNRVELLLFVFVATYFLCCGDVEVNPGPVDRDAIFQLDISTESDSVTGSSDTDKTSARPPSVDCAADSGFLPDFAKQLLEAMHLQREQSQTLSNDMSLLQKDLGSIKTDISYVRTKCDDIGRRCDRLEEENERLSSSVKGTREDVDELFCACRQNEDNLSALFAEIGTMKTEIDDLKEHCDTLEAFSRRDNLRLFGVPQTEQFESYDSCARLVVDTLNSVEAPKQWTADDIARAHRVGESRNGQPKPMIVKFSRWRDKMAVITNREYQARLEGQGVRVANDLTRKQAGIVAEAKKEGKVAFFRRGKLMVVPRPDPRTYAEVAAATNDDPDAGDTSTNNPATEQPKHNASRRGGHEGTGHNIGGGHRRGGDSPRSSREGRRGSARGGCGGAHGGYGSTRDGCGGAHGGYGSAFGGGGSARGGESGARGGGATARGGVGGARGGVGGGGTCGGVGGTRGVDRACCSDSSVRAGGESNVRSGHSDNRNGGSRHTGVNVTQPRSSQSSPVNKCPGNNPTRPRRSTRTNP